MCFANAELDFLPHHVTLQAIQKVEAVLKFPRPKNRKQVQALLWIAGYYRKYLSHYAELTLPLTELIKKNKQFVWSDVCERWFEDLKSRVASQPILRPPDYNKNFCVAVDALQGTVGGCLFQVRDWVNDPVSFLSRKLNKHQLRYSTIEKEVLVLITSVLACSVYIGSNPVVVYYDYSPL